MQEQNNQANAMQVAAQTAKDASDVAKIAKQAATGNAAGATVTLLGNGSLMKKFFCVVLAIVMLITCCVCSVPNMVWEAAESSKNVIVEQAASAGNAAYFIFYGTSDGHEGLTGILTALPRAIDMVMEIASAWWSIFTGDFDDATISEMSEGTQMLLNQIYTDQDKYYKEAQAGVVEGSDGSTGMKLALNNKRLATKLRIGGHVSDLKKAFRMILMRRSRYSMLM